VSMEFYEVRQESFKDHSFGGCAAPLRSIG
jgi:hypothetical protein